MRLRRFVVLLLCMAALPSLAQTSASKPSPSKPALMTADECAVWARELSFAKSVADHDATAFAAHLHENAAFGTSRPEPTRGRDAITKRWGAIIEGKALTIEWYPTRTTIAPGVDNIAWSSGPSLVIDRDPASKQPYSIGAFHSVWHQGADGVWRVLFDDGVEGKPAGEADVAAFRAARREACPRD